MCVSRVSRGCFDGPLEGLIDNAYLSIWGVDANKAPNSTYSLAHILALTFEPTRDLRLRESSQNNALPPVPSALDHS